MVLVSIRMRGATSGRFFVTVTELHSLGLGQEDGSIANLPLSLRCVFTKCNTPLAIVNERGIFSSRILVYSTELM